MPKKSTSTAPLAPFAPDLSREVDELGTLERELAPLAFKIARVEALRRIIRANYAEAVADQAYEALGDKFLVLIGPRGVQQQISIPKLAKFVSVRTFRELASVTIKSLEALAPEAIPACVSLERTGPRTLKTFERGTVTG